MVDGIQLGRVFTMFEKDEVRSVAIYAKSGLSQFGECTYKSVHTRRQTRFKGDGCVVIKALSCKFTLFFKLAPSACHVGGTRYEDL